MSRKPYPSDLSDAEWEKIKPLLPEANKLGSPREVDLREILNAIFYRVDNGCKRRAMPHDFPPSNGVRSVSSMGQNRSVATNQFNQSLVQQVRVCEGRNEEPTLAIIESRSVKRTQKG
jgi:putative transposase